MFRTAAVMVRLWLAGFVACVVAVSGTAQQQSSIETFNSVAARASAARMADRAAEAIELYQQALKMRPSWAKGWWHLGTLLYEADRYAEALTPFAKLAEARPKGGAAWAMLGLCEFQLGRYEQALAHLQRGRALGLAGNQPLSVATRFHVAILLNRLGQPETALQLLYSVAHEEDESPSLLQALGLSALRLPDLPGDAPEKNQLLLIAGRAQYYTAIRNMVEAHRAWDELVSRYSDTPNVHYAFGVFPLGANPGAALAEFRRELEISPSHVPARLQVAFEYIKQSEYAAGLPFAEDAVKLDPRLLAARSALGQILLGLRQPSRAIKELETAGHYLPITQKRATR